MTAVQPISTDAAFQLLAVEQRRTILRHLVSSTGPVPLADLVGAVSTASSSPSDPDARTRQVALAIHHVHLPMLQAAGLLEYDQSTDTIHYQPDDRVETILSACP